MAHINECMLWFLSWNQTEYEIWENAISNIAISNFNTSTVEDVWQNEQNENHRVEIFSGFKPLCLTFKCILIYFMSKTKRNTV